MMQYLKFDNNFLLLNVLINSLYTRKHKLWIKFSLSQNILKWNNRVQENNQMCL